MKLLSGAALEPSRFFKAGNPGIQASSFDLSIGHIFDHDGKEIAGPFTLKPGHMVQVASAEVFDLPDNITGHVTYRTRLTKQGIWALTVGIVDPGWNGPIATTLLNFSSVGHTIHVGDPFLRVSLIEHDPVPDKRRIAPQFDEYIRSVQSLAASRFPETFLNSDQIAQDAGKAVLNRIRIEGLAWLTATAILFAAIQVLAPPVANLVNSAWSPGEADGLAIELDTMKARILELERELGSLKADQAPVEPSQ